MTLKRLVAPDWGIERKTKKFVVKPKPGPHSLQNCIPLGVVIRDMLKYANTMKEAKQILNAGYVLVDGTARRDNGFPVGLMDVISMGSEHYRVVSGRKGPALKKITDAESGIKLLRIQNKTCVSGKVQLNFHDGRNMLIDKNAYSTGDVAVFELGKKAVRDVIKMEKGSLALITAGKNRGSLGKIDEIIVTKSSMPNQVAVDLGERKVTLPKDYIFVVGKETPAVHLGEGR